MRREYGWLLQTPVETVVLPERDLRPGETLTLPEALKEKARALSGGRA